MAEPVNLSRDILLNNGLRMPVVGLGTLSMNGPDLQAAVQTAIECGYRHVDTAHKYGNEAALGDALRGVIESGEVSREQLFVTTKLARSRMGRDHVRHSCEESLQRLQLEYLDLYLVHAPFGYKYRENELLPKDEDGRFEYEHYDMAETWREMEKLVDEGKVRSIGVSNFNSIQLDGLCRAARILPVTNQVEVHPYLPQYALNEFCLRRGIILSAYAPLGAPRRAALYRRENDSVLLEEPVIVELAGKYNKTPAQILLRDTIQRGIAVLPKSSTPARIRDNIEIFDFRLEQEDVVSIAELNVKQRRYYDMLWMAEGHPDYPFTAAY